MLSEKNSTVVWTGQYSDWKTRASNWVRRILLGFVQFYQFHLSGLFGGNCRFYPTCSEYAVDALKERSLSKASRLILHRLSKCHPFGESGYDPVPCKERTK